MRYPVEVLGRIIGVLSLTVIFILSAQYPLFAQRPNYTSIASDIDSVDVIIHAVVGENENTDNGSLFIPDDDPIPAEIIEVLKGNPQLPEIHFMPMTTVQEIRPGRQVILLRKGADNRFYEFMSYSEDYLPRLHCLIPIMEEKDETVRLQRLAHLLREPSSVCPQVDWRWTVDTSNSDTAAINESMKTPESLEALERDVTVQIGKVRDQSNFDIVAQAIDTFSAAGQGNVLNWIADTGDLRAVPVLLKYLDSEDDDVRGIAARRLGRDFPGAEGVTEAFREKWKSADGAVRSEAVAYLMKREPDPDLRKAYLELDSLPDTSSSAASNSFSTNARNAFSEGRTDNAKKYCIEVIRNASLYDRTRLDLMNCIGTALSREDQDLYLPEAAPFLERMMRARNRAAAMGTIPIVLSVKHPALISALVAYLDREDTFILWNENAFRAVMDLKEMGEEDRAAGARILLNWIENSSGDPPDWDSNLQRLMALMWLGDDRDLDRARQFLLKNSPEYFRRIYSNMIESLAPVSEMNDEGAFLVGIILKYPPRNISGGAIKWLYVRLWQMGKAWSLPLLLERFEHYGYPLSPEMIAEGLDRFGDPVVSWMETMLLEHPKDLLLYRNLEVVLDYRKEKCIPFIRQLVKDRQGKLTNSIIFKSFSQYGTAEDIALLSSIFDYWEYGPNSSLQNALADLRERHGYDLNGPIEK